MEVDIDKRVDPLVENDAWKQAQEAGQGRASGPQKGPLREADEHEARRAEEEEAEEFVREVNKYNEAEPVLPEQGPKAHNPYTTAGSATARVSRILRWRATPFGPRNEFDEDKLERPDERKREQESCLQTRIRGSRRRRRRHNDRQSLKVGDGQREDRGGRPPLAKPC